MLSSTNQQYVFTVLEPRTTTRDYSKSSAFFSIWQWEHKMLCKLPEELYFIVIKI